MCRRSPRRAPALPSALVALVVLALAAAPATAARDRCPRTAGGPPLSAAVVANEAIGSSLIVVCDRRTGRTRAMRRSFVDFFPRRGRLVHRARAVGLRVVWLEATFRRGGDVVKVAVADGRTGRLLSRQAVLRARRLDETTFYGSDVVMTTRGEVAWMAGVRRDDFRVRFVAPGGASVELDRGRIVSLVLEDDGTLVWRREPGGVFSEAMLSYDLPGRDFGAGCPKRRSGFGSVLDTPEVVFTKRASVLRACDPATGRDLIVGHELSHDGTQRELLPLGGGNGWAAISVAETLPRDECGLVRLLTVEIATGRAGRRTMRTGCRGGFVGVGFPPTVVTATGVPAFVEEGRLFTVGAETTDGENGRLIELDRGDVRDLRAEGEELTWTNGGEPRRARP